MLNAHALIPENLCCGTCKHFQCHEVTVRWSDLALDRSACLSKSPKSMLMHFAGDTIPGLLNLPAFCWIPSVITWLPGRYGEISDPRKPVSPEAHLYYPRRSRG